MVATFVAASRCRGIHLARGWQVGSDHKVRLLMQVLSHNSHCADGYLMCLRVFFKALAEEPHTGTRSVSNARLFLLAGYGQPASCSIVMALPREKDLRTKAPCVESSRFLQELCTPSTLTSARCGRHDRRRQLRIDRACVRAGSQSSDASKVGSAEATYGVGILHLLFKKPLLFL